MTPGGGRATLPTERSFGRHRRGGSQAWRQGLGCTTPGTSRPIAGAIRALQVKRLRELLRFVARDERVLPGALGRRRRRHRAGRLARGARRAGADGRQERLRRRPAGPPAVRQAPRARHRPRRAARDLHDQRHQRPGRRDPRADRARARRDGRDVPLPVPLGRARSGRRRGADAAADDARRRPHRVAGRRRLRHHRAAGGQHRRPREAGAARALPAEGPVRLDVVLRPPARGRGAHAAVPVDRGPADRPRGRRLLVPRAAAAGLGRGDRRPVRLHAAARRLHVHVRARHRHRRPPRPAAQPRPVHHHRGDRRRDRACTSPTASSARWS